jgi:hypothetical protein
VKFWAIRGNSFRARSWQNGCVGDRTGIAMEKFMDVTGTTLGRAG